MLLDEYKSLPVPWVLENGTLAQGGAMTILYVGVGVSLVGMFMMLTFKRKRVLPGLLCFVLGISAAGAGFWGSNEVTGSSDITAYNQSVHRLISDRAVEKYGVQFAETVDPKILTVGKSKVKIDGSVVEVQVGFTKDGDLIILDGTKTELPKR